MPSLFDTTTRDGERVPGVYFTAPKTGPDAARVRMDVPCFVGLAERGPLHTAVAVESWSQYMRYFGRCGRRWMMPDAVRLFFANGGRRCVVVRALNYAESRFASGTVAGLTLGGAPLSLMARDPGRWGWHLEVVFTVHRAPITARWVEPDRLEGTSSSVEVGSVLRLVWFDAAGDKADTLVVVDEVDGHQWRLTEPLDGDLLGPGGVIQARVEELSLEVTARHGPTTERFSRLGLSRAHRAWAPAVIDEESVLLRAPSSVVETDEPSLQLDLHASMDVVWDDLAPGAEPDAEAETARQHFFDPTGTNPAPDDPYGGRPALQEVLAEYDEGVQELLGAPGHLTEPITMICMPDLVHRRAGAFDHDDDVDDADAADVTLEFEPCHGARPPEVTPWARQHWYPHLVADGSIDPSGPLVTAAQRLVELCEDTHRLAILELPPGADPGSVVAWRRALSSRHAATYGPWIEAPSEDGDRLVVRGPGGAVCGIVARAEKASGMAGVPANKKLIGALRPFVWQGLPDERFLFEERVNAIRHDRRGVRLMGSRTIGGDRHSGHVNVWRVLAFLRRQLPLDVQWALFEPNNRHLWRRVRQTVTRRLDALLASGALKGSKPEDAYFVRCDGQINTVQRTDQGHLLVYVGVAPAVPAEFIEIRLALTTDSVTVEVA